MDNTEVSRVIGQLEGTIKAHIENTDQNMTEIKADVKLLLEHKNQQTGALKAASASYGFAGGLLGAIGSALALKFHN